MSREQIPEDLVIMASTFKEAAKWLLRAKTAHLVIVDGKAKCIVPVSGYVKYEHSPLMNWLKRVVDEAIQREDAARTGYVRERKDIQMDAQTSMEMPRYKCHKEVHALKIAKLKPPIPKEQGGSGLWAIVPEEPAYAPFTVSDEYMQKHEPKVGGYYVVCKDGYKSFSPADVFESGYTRMGLTASK